MIPICVIWLSGASFIPLARWRLVPVPLPCLSNIPLGIVQTTHTALSLVLFPLAGLVARRCCPGPSLLCKARALRIHGLNMFINLRTLSSSPLDLFFPFLFASYLFSPVHSSSSHSEHRSSLSDNHSRFSGLDRKDKMRCVPSSKFPS